jgi:aspartyl-tRNA(Asn)/glutamyl-tRNA(Gln) amidotransferase subunit A
MSEPCALSLSEAAAAIRGRRLTPLDLLESTLARIEAAEPAVRAWARVRAEEARAEARSLTEARPDDRRLGPLHGIPVGIKDIFYTAGIETACGSRIMAGFVPTWDATAVARLRGAGAIIVGKTHTTEFASFDPSPARNPWDVEHTPGGSSSGSAAALAARMCHGALGSQTAGSIVRPAAFCGVVGLKPTFGRVSRHGVHPLAWTLDHPGPMARTVRDVALLLDVIAGPDPHDPTTLSAPAPPSALDAVDALPGTSAPLRGVRVGVPDRYFLDEVEPEAHALHRGALSALESLGCAVETCRLPPEFEAGMAAHEIIQHGETAAVHVDRYRARPGDYGERLRAQIEAGLRVPAPTYLRAQQIRTLVIAGLRTALRELDGIVTPATLGPAPRGLASTGSPALNRPFSFTGFPSASVPCGFTEAGLPVGLQIGGTPFAESGILRIAAAYERATRWGEREPVVPRPRR